MTALSARAAATEGNGPGWYAALPLVRRLPVEWQPNPRVFLTMGDYSSAPSSPAAAAS